jgi:hypothetical protein
MAALEASLAEVRSGSSDAVSDEGAKTGGKRKASGTSKSGSNGSKASSSGGAKGTRAKAKAKP